MRFRYTVAAVGLGNFGRPGLFLALGFWELRFSSQHSASLSSVIAFLDHFFS